VIRTCWSLCHFFLCLNVLHLILPSHFCFCKWNIVQMLAFRVQMRKLSFLWDNIRALIFYIVPSSFCTLLERRRRGVFLEIGQAFLSYVKQHTSYDACLLTAWSRVLEKLTSSQLFKEFPVVWKPKVHYCFCKCPPPVLVVSTSYGAL